jgi:MFS family permease
MTDATGLHDAGVPAPLDPHGVTRWRNAVIGAFGLGGITIASWGPRLPAVIAALHTDTGVLGLVLGCVTIGSIVGLLTSTPLLHWLRSRLAVGGALVVIAATLATIGVGVAIGSIPLVTVAFIVIGFGIGTLDVLINVEGAAVEQAAGRTLMPLMHGGWSVGAAVGAGLGAACAALGIAPATQFIAEGVVIAVAGVVLATFIAPGVRHEEPHEPQSRLQKIVAWARGWLDWRLLLIGVVMLGVELAEGSASNWMTLAVHDDHGQPVAVAALFFTAFAVAEAIARIFGGPVVDRLGRVRTTRVTTALGVVGVVLFILGGNPLLVLLGVLLWAVGVSMGFPLGMSAAAESGPNPVARVSVVASIAYLANLAGPPMIGLLAEHLGLLNTLWIVVVLMAAACLCAGSLRRPKAS